MPAKKQPTAMDSTTRQAVAKRTGMKKLGDFYAGKGAGSADTQAARGASRRAATYKMAASEGSKRKSPAKKSDTGFGVYDSLRLPGAKKSASGVIRAAAKVNFNSRPAKSKSGGYGMGAKKK
jgi:hypothetical protein